MGGVGGARSKARVHMVFLLHSAKKGFYAQRPHRVPLGIGVSITRGEVSQRLCRIGAFQCSGCSILLVDTWAARGTDWWSPGSWRELPSSKRPTLWKRNCFKSGSFPMSRLLASGGQSIGASASALASYTCSHLPHWDCSDKQCVKGFAHRSGRAHV